MNYIRSAGFIHCRIKQLFTILEVLNCRGLTRYAVSLELLLHNVRFEKCDNI